MCIIIAKFFPLHTVAFIRITASVMHDNREGIQVPLFFWSVKKLL